MSKTVRPKNTHLRKLCPPALVEAITRITRKPDDWFMPEVLSCSHYDVEAVLLWASTKKSGNYATVGSLIDPMRREMKQYQADKPEWLLSAITAAGRADCHVAWVLDDIEELEALTPEERAKGQACNVDGYLNDDLRYRRVELPEAREEAEAARAALEEAMARWRAGQ